MRRLLNDPRSMARFHAGMTVVFIALIPVSLFTSLKDSVPYLVFLSLWALVSGHWSCYQAACAERKVDEQVAAPI